MKVTLLFAADTQSGLSELGQKLSAEWAGDRIPQSLLNLASPYQDLLNLLEDRIVAAVLYHHVMPNDQDYHSIGVMDIDGITYVVHDRQTISGLLGEVTMESEFVEMQEKARRLDQIVAAVGSHKLRMFQKDMADSFDTLGQLYTWLDEGLNKGNAP